MSGAGEQLVLDLGHRPALGAEDFILSECNAAAVAFIDRWPDWPGPALALIGPRGSGKSHLANVWRLRSGARRIAAAEADERALLEAAEAGACVIEDLDRGIADERALFHLLNLTRERAVALLLTARSHPGHWTVGLPDLRSRLRSLPVTAIEPPDEALLRAVLVKLLADRQLPATPHAVTHLARHMERSFEMALEIVEALDRALWQRPREVTRDLARKVLAEVAERNGAE